MFQLSKQEYCGKIVIPLVFFLNSIPITGNIRHAILDIQNQYFSTDTLKGHGSTRNYRVPISGIFNTDTTYDRLANSTFRLSFPGSSG